VLVAAVMIMALTSMIGVDPIFETAS
jgi:hypothetical protein